METKRLSTRIEEETHRRLKVQAAYYGRSMEQIIEEALQEWLTAVETLPGHPQQEDQT